MVEKVFCYKNRCTAYDEYYFVYGDTLNPPKGLIIGFIIFIDGETEISIKDDSLAVPQIIELLYDCLEDKKSFKIKF